MGAVAANMLLAYAMFMLCRVAYFVENWASFAPYMSWELAVSMFRGGLVFDTSALLYLDALYILLTLLPLHLKERRGFHLTTKWLYIVPNVMGMAMNLADAVYFTYTGRRTTATVFSEFGNENNIAAIIGTEFVRHWYLVLLFAAMVYAMWRLYRTPDATSRMRRGVYYAVQVLSLLVAVPLTIVGMRGSTAFGTRPITISNANQYVNRAVESSVVLNTPFAMMRTVGKATHEVPGYMTDDEMNAIYSPEHNVAPIDSLQCDTTRLLRRKNVVVIIAESLGKEYSRFFNRKTDGSGYKGYTPFVDSLAAQSLTFRYSFANGRISMDANPSVLSGIPMMVEPFVLSSASLNDVEGLPSLLKDYGYHSAFFHGGHNITMGFSAFAHSIGFDEYFGLDEYCRSPKYNGYGDFDGKWAIFDEPFLQYFADELATMREPFVATVFTATSHHPYPIPEKYRDVYTDEDGLEILKCVRYADMSLQRFFERVSRMPWYRNTLFVVVADHTNQTAHAEYKTDLGLFAVPILFFTPDGSIQPEFRDDCIAQQTDILPTIMGYLGCKKPFVAFGVDLNAAPSAETWAVNFNNGIYQYIKGDYLLQFDGTATKAVYAFKTDTLLRNNLAGQCPDQPAMERELKAIIMQYMERMTQNRLTVKR